MLLSWFWLADYIYTDFTVNASLISCQLLLQVKSAKDRDVGQFQTQVALQELPWMEGKRSILAIERYCYCHLF